MKLEKLKGLLGILEDDLSYDVYLQFILEDVQEIILNYCNIPKIPKGLLSIAYRMAVDLYRGEQFGEKNTPFNVTSISIGGTSTGYSNSAEPLKENVLRDYKGQLNRYRKLVW